MEQHRAIKGGIVEIYKPVFIFGTRLGIFPQDIVDDVFPESELDEPGGKREKSLKHLAGLLGRYAFVGVFMSHFSFTVVMVLACFAGNSIRSVAVTPEQKVAGTSWILASLFSFTIVVTSHHAKPKMRALISSFLQMESKIIKENVNFTVDGWSVAECLRTERRIFLGAILFETVTTVLTSTSIGLNVALNPRLPAHIYSLVNEDVSMPWLEVVSACAQVWFSISVAIIRGVAQLLCICISQSLILSLRILSNTSLNLNNNKPEERGTSSLWTATTTAARDDDVRRMSSFETAVMEYKEVREVVRRYNEIFANGVIAYKGISLMMTSILLYSAMKDRMNSPKLGLVVFPVVSIIHILRIFQILYFMGNLYPRSKEFRHKWRRSLAETEQLNERNQAILSSCYPFGFKAGNFYTIKSSTVLTFFSILMSYIILAFQL